VGISVAASINGAQPVRACSFAWGEHRLRAICKVAAGTINQQQARSLGPSNARRCPGSIPAKGGRQTDTAPHPVANSGSEPAAAPQPAAHQRSNKESKPALSTTRPIDTLAGHRSRNGVNAASPADARSCPRSRSRIRGRTVSTIESRVDVVDHFVHGPDQVLVSWGLKRHAYHKFRAAGKRAHSCVRAASKGLSTSCCHRSAPAP